MVYLILGMAVFFVLIGFSVTTGNAKYLLSGYNTMSNEEREKFDIASYIPAFRRFHVFLGISFLIFGITLLYFLGENAAGLFLAIYPILGYMYFIGKSKKYQKAGSSRSTTWASLILAGCLILVVALFAFGYREDALIFDHEKIKIEGTYGEELLPDEIQSVELVAELPDIKMRSNGFSMGSIKKGYFKTAEGETVKLLLNAQNPPYLKITKVDGKQLFYSSGERSGEELFQEMKTAFPNLESR